MSASLTSLTWLNRLQQHGGQTEWQTFGDVYRPLLMRWLTRTGVPPADREDLVQNALLVVVRQVGGFEHRHAGSFRGWLRMIVANVLRDYFRRNQRSVAGIPLDALEDPASELSRWMDREHDLFVTARLMQSVRQDFNASTWQAFELQVLHGLTAEAAAAQLNISANAALKSKCRVLTRLRDELSWLLPQTE
jgi:RNA polymerase sigma factor (sigma-70 family)